MNINVLAVIILDLILLISFMINVRIGLLFKAKSADVNITLMNLIGMRLRMADAKKIILPMIRAKENGIDLEPNYVEAHYLAAGNIENLVQILIDAQHESIDISFKEACLVDLNGYDFNTYKKEYGLSAKF